MIEAEKEENKPLEVFIEEVVQSIESEIEGEHEVIVPVEPLKEVIGEETYAKVELLKPEEKIVVLLAELGELDEKLSQNNLMDNKGLIVSEANEAVDKVVTQAMRQMNPKEENAFECFEQVVDIVRRATSLEHGVKELLDVARRDVFNRGNTVFRLKKTKQIVDLLFIVPDGAGRELPALTMEKELVTDGRPPHATSASRSDTASESA